ncbi:MAG: hypothetical protein U0230_23115 [Polyangiales bacterium]
MTACHGNDARTPSGVGDAGQPLSQCSTDTAVQAPAFDVGGAGHADPLGVQPGQARAGRVMASQLPAFTSNLQVWEGGDFVLANEKVAIVIEDVDDSDLYDPWGGRPVGIAHVRNGQLVDVGDFGELLLTPAGEYAVVTEHVGVLADGSDGGPAIVRAEGRLAPLPFFYGLVNIIFNSDYRDGTRGAIDYILAPGSSHVDIRVRFRNVRPDPVSDTKSLHAFMFDYRLKAFQPDGTGFGDDQQNPLDFWAFVDDSNNVGYAYSIPTGEQLTTLISASGFVGSFGPPSEIKGCEQGETVREHGRITIGGPDLDGLLAAVAAERGDAQRAITGVVRDAGGTPQPGVRVHAVRADDHSHYLTRVRTDADGRYTIHVPDGVAVDVYAYRRGEALVGPVNVPATTATQDLGLAARGVLHVAAPKDSGGNPIPAKIQIFPRNATSVPGVPGRWGEEGVAPGRLDVRYLLPGESVDIPVPQGDWRVVASRGFRYEVASQDFTLDGTTTSANFAPSLTQVVSTPDVYCADYHIHSRRSNDAPDDTEKKLRAAIAEGLELPVRSEHEFVDPWDHVIADDLGAGDLAVGISSTELSTMERYGHFGVFPLDYDPTRPNGGTPLWQEYPTATNPGIEVRELTPAELFASIRARPEDPMLIVNHPRGGTNFFTFAGYDPVTGMVAYPSRWSSDFDGIEVFNGSGWTANRNGTVRDFLSFLNHGTRMVAVGSSDTHAIAWDPIGYPRTCLDFTGMGATPFPAGAGPRRAYQDLVRDVTMAGRAAVNGGIWVESTVSGQGPGSTVTGLSAGGTLHLVLRAPSWVDVDRIEIVLDGQSYNPLDPPGMSGTPPSTLAVADHCTAVGAVRCTLDVPLPAAGPNSYVVVAAYGDADDSLAPVMRSGIKSFGVSNPIYLRP